MIQIEVLKLAQLIGATILSKALLRARLANNTGFLHSYLESLRKKALERAHQLTGPVYNRLTQIWKFFPNHNHLI